MSVSLGGGGGGEEGAALDAGGCGVGVGGCGDDETAGVGIKTSSADTTRVDVTPTSTTLESEIVTPSVDVAGSWIVPSRGSQAPLPIGPPS